VLIVKWKYGTCSFCSTKMF